MLRALSLALLTCLSVGKAYASSCVNPKLEKIRFTPGAVCWDYEGTATHFQGTFAAGQKVRVEMHGITHSYDQTFANSNKIEWEFRSPSISGPDQKLLTPTADSEDGVIEATLPKSGTYTFDFSPCAMWNYYGLVRICTRP